MTSTAIGFTFQRGNYHLDLWHLRNFTREQTQTFGSSLGFLPASQNALVLLRTLLQPLFHDIQQTTSVDQHSDLKDQILQIRPESMSQQRSREGCVDVLWNLLVDRKLFLIIFDNFIIRKQILLEHIMCQSSAGGRRTQNLDQHLKSFQKKLVYFSKPFSFCTLQTDELDVDEAEQSIAGALM